MINLKLSYCLLVIGLFFSSCKHDEGTIVSPSLNASFTQDKEAIHEFDTIKTVTFTNTSTKAVRYEWDFGNGQTSTLANPTADFWGNGTYIIKLTAFDSENNASTYVSTVKFGSIYFKKVKYFQIPFDNNRYSWDDNVFPFNPNNPSNFPSNYPDVFAAVKYTFSPQETNVTNDVMPSMLPLEQSFTGLTKVYPTKHNIDIADKDPQTLGHEVMEIIQFNGERIYYKWNRKGTEISYRPKSDNPNQVSDIEIICEFRDF